MSPLLVAYGGELLTTEELAGIIGDHLTAAGHAVHTVPVDHASPAWHYDAVVIGSELYGQHWSWQALTYLRQNIPDLTARPTFFFQHVSHAGAGTGTVKLSRLVRLLAYEIGSALPQSFGVDQTPAQRRTSAAAWATRVGVDLSRPTGPGEGGHHTENANEEHAMRAMVYTGPQHVEWTETPFPQLLDSRDAIVQVDAATICGTDLHILHGDVPDVRPGRVLGHEAVGTVVEAGAASGRTVGERVLVSCISACGRCRSCRIGRFGLCTDGGGWLLGHHIDGTHAEFVRVPFADTSLHPLPRHVSDDAALLLSDIFPTAYEVGVLNGQVRPGDTVVIVGAGPIGLAAVVTARLFSPGHVISVDPSEFRRETARRFGADTAIAPAATPAATPAADAVDGTAADPVRALVDRLTAGAGADVVMEAVGTPAAFEACVGLVRPGGRVANIGVHGASCTLHLERLWDKGITITTGLVDTSSTPALLGMLASGQIDTTPFVTQHFELEDVAAAYQVFAAAGSFHTLKVALTRTVGAAPKATHRMQSQPVTAPAT